MKNDIPKNINYNLIIQKFLHMCTKLLVANISLVLIDLNLLRTTDFLYSYLQF